MVLYTCDICIKEFKQKIDYERHKNRKIKCTPKEIVVNEIIKNTSSNIPELEIFNTLIPPKSLISSNVDNKDETNHNKCINCNKKFTRADNYNRHILYRCKYIDISNKNDDNVVIDLLTKINERQLKMEEENKQQQQTIEELKIVYQRAIFKRSMNIVIKLVVMVKLQQYVILMNHCLPF